MYCVCPVTRGLELVPSLCEVTSKLESQDGSSCHFYPLPYTRSICFFLLLSVMPQQCYLLGRYLGVTCHILKDLLLTKKEQCKLPSLSAPFFWGIHFPMASGSAGQTFRCALPAYLRPVHGTGPVPLAGPLLLGFVFCLVREFHGL